MKKPRARERPLILIADDNLDQREMYAEYLAVQGFGVVAVADGETAIAVATEVAPDLIVLDLSLPLVNGWEVARRLKASPRTSGIVILACTGHAFAPSLELALRAGCDAYVLKPCFPQDLVKEIRRLLY